MKKLSILFLSTLMAVCLFSSCSDDDDDKKDPVVPTEKKVKTIKAYEEAIGNTYNASAFTYDAQGRVSKIAFASVGPKENIVTTPQVTFEYGNKTIKYKYTGTDTDEGTVTLGSNGFAESFTKKYTDDGETKEHKYTHTYESGYLVQCKEQGTDFVVKYGWTANNLATITLGEKVVTKATYGTVKNTGNIDLNYLAADAEFYELFGEFSFGNAFGWFGKRSDYRLTMTEEIDGEETEKMKYTYEYDADNYVTKITVTDDADKVENIYVITWE